MFGVLVRWLASRRFSIRRSLNARNGLLVVGLVLVMYGAGGVAGSSGRWAVVGGQRECVRLMPASSLGSASAGFVAGSYRAWAVSGGSVVGVPVGGRPLVLSAFSARGASLGSRLLGGGSSWRLPSGVAVLLGSGASRASFFWSSGSCSAA